MCRLWEWLSFGCWHFQCGRSIGRSDKRPYQSLFCMTLSTTVIIRTSAITIEHTNPHQHHHKHQHRAHQHQRASAPAPDVCIVSPCVDAHRIFDVQSEFAESDQATSEGPDRAAAESWPRSLPSLQS